MSPSEPAAAADPGRVDVEALFAEHHATLVRYLTRLSGDPDLAADAAQEAFVRLVERRPEPRGLRSWLFRVATNVVRERARTRSHRRRLLEEQRGHLPAGHAPAAPDARLVNDELRRRVRGALARLSERDRTILLMREEGFKHREIAEAVGTTTGSVGTMIARALDKLAAELPLDEEDA